MSANMASINEIWESVRMDRRAILKCTDSFIARYKEKEPHIHAFIPEQNFPDRIRLEAKVMLDKYRESAALPPLYGVPVAVKDLFHVSGLPTAAGSALPPKELTGEEGSLLGRLRSLGALIAGKTVTEEFAYAGPIPTRNPHHPNHTPGGSSAGSAASVAAGICPLAVGTQTLRSVIGPASFCGVVGFKPSYGRVPLDGVILLSPSFDTIGFFTSDIESMSLAAAHLVPGWRPFRADRKPVLGIPKGAYMSMMFDDVRTMFERQVERLTDAGFAVREVEMPWDDAFVLGDAMLRLVQGEMARVHRDWFAKYSGLYGESVFLAITSGMSITEQELAEYRKGQAVLRTKLSAAAAGGQHAQQIDLWISPSQGGTAPLWGGRTGWSGMTAIWSYAGLPQLTIPAAKLNGLSVGFQYIGRYGEDEAALCWGEQIAAAVREIAQPNDPVA